MKEHLLKAGANMEVTFKDWNLWDATCPRLIWNMIHSHPGSWRGRIVEDSSSQDLVQDLARCGNFQNLQFVTSTILLLLSHKWNWDLFSWYRFSGDAPDQRHHADQLLQRPHQGLKFDLNLEISKVTLSDISDDITWWNFYQNCFFELFFIDLFSDYPLPTLGRCHLHWRGAQEQDLQVGIKIVDQLFPTLNFAPL